MTIDYEHTIYRQSDMEVVHDCKNAIATLRASKLLQREGYIYLLVT